jgi:hypothetical protein
MCDVCERTYIYIYMCVCERECVFCVCACACRVVILIFGCFISVSETFHTLLFPPTSSKFRCFTPMLSKLEITSSTKALPIIRCITDTDPVPYLFPHCSHYGAEVVLLTNQYYALIRTPTPKEIPQWKKSNIEEVFKAHSAAEYVSRLESKTESPVRVSVSASS